MNCGICGKKIKLVAGKWYDTALFAAAVDASGVTLASVCCKDGTMCFHQLAKPEDVATAAPRTQGRELAEFVECAQGICESATWPTIGDIDRLRKLGKVAFPGGYKTIQSLAQAQPQPAPSCPKCGSHALYMRHIEPHIGYSAVQCPVCLPSGSFILKTPADFAQFFTALPEATKEDK